ncbi:GNAT family N-acetyltransferase [Senegalia massiliensis]|uniref:GNAT family N-acetyltransferase n=1 Tax=Senegalia massiliensis TaxID=1720316 RepID=A0A845R089_9CLOT|nr:GNAT family N-acetyltransferase [Senegalia massiliensis]NBI07991.1 GNAT family N-acetyltransferase [Senegalia massiliensis]
MKYNDVYFTKKYGKLYEKIENGTLEIFEYNSKMGSIKNIFLKREIPINTNGEKYYDLITPYGYGGPIIVSCNDESKKDELIKGYYKEFKKFCFKNNVVSEFIRFHPINNNAKDFMEIYEVEYLRKTIGTNLKNYDDPIKSEFKKGCRKEIRRAFNKGVLYKIKKSPTNLDTFKKLYYETMDRNNAVDYYYFDDQYFDDILIHFKDELLLVELIYENKIIASEIYLISSGLIHAHLLGSLDEYLYLSAGCILEYATALWGKENNYDYIHHGGGRTNAEADKLLKNKRKFGKNTEFDFYVGKKIWNKNKYKELVEIRRREKEFNTNNSFFPLYRA